MISVLAQERLLGAALGTVFMGAVIFQQHRSIHQSISETQSLFFPQYQLKGRIYDKQQGLDLAHLWNKAVDQTFGPVIVSLSSKGW
ncbi:uncharacterized protein LOC113779091 isoform X2 [Coffea eugenioides]|uniref:Uncharacterized protein LOC113708009 isoform X2 n=1 Tax=Coffea arabica TaxID=13443 RepID=A0A6P6U711_COFAR|nr:uncharacterized protein LOC113708009 isoform X2 [Coffea arabica]XP_027086251.1 uncharacterized protein LOC113708009 isoform X2 [Coffea arabica]XP_027180342.1 uncharacterized protein LOC113779091 isoform X2 [Coffea eugenioides]XP_027180352.1 uncharacterized protein LOC113779091 isoform X2 [Coffea eugenioides]